MIKVTNLTKTGICCPGDLTKFERRKILLLGPCWV